MTKLKTNNLEKIMERFVECQEKNDKKNMIKYCDMMIEKEKYDLSIYVLYHYSYKTDIGDFKKNINIIQKYCDIFIDNYDSNKYDENCVKKAKFTFGIISQRLYDISNYDLMEKIANFGLNEWESRSCGYILGKYYFRKGKYSKSESFWKEVIHNSSAYIKHDDDDFMNKVLFENGFDDLKDYYAKKGIDQNDLLEKESFQNALNDYKKFYFRIEEETDDYDYLEYEIITFSATINLDNDIKRIFDVIEYCNNKRYTCGKIKKNKNDILKDFLEFLFEELQIAKIDKNKERIMKFITEYYGDRDNFVDDIHILIDHLDEEARDLKEKIYEMLIEKQNHNCRKSLLALAIYYEIKNMYDLSLKYYKICFEKHQCSFSLNFMTNILLENQEYDKLLTYENIVQNSHQYSPALLNFGDYYCIKKDYKNMLKCYSGIPTYRKADAIYVSAHDKAKIKMAKYYEIIEKDYEKAKKNYNLIINKNRVKGFIVNFEKKYGIYAKMCKNKIYKKSNCCICCDEKTVFIKLLCCAKLLCVKCMTGVINCSFKCPFCRNERFKCDKDVVNSYDFETVRLLYNDEDIENFINGVYYQDEYTNSDYDSENENVD